MNIESFYSSPIRSHKNSNKNENKNELNKEANRELILYQIAQIKKNYFTNIFNEKFITESYEFIEENNILDIEKSHYLNLPLEFYFLDKFIFEEIRSIYNTNYKGKQGNKQSINRKQLIEFNLNDQKLLEDRKENKIDLDIVTLKGNIVEDDIGFISKYPEESKEFQAKRVKAENMSNRNNIRNEAQDNQNLNADLIKETAAIQLDKEREEANKREKQMQETLNKLKIHYEKDELNEIYKVFSNIKNNSDLKKEFFKQNKINESQFNLEENLLYYFKSLMNDKESYTKIGCKEFDLSYKLVDKLLYIRIAKELEANLVDLIALIYENQYYPMWFPFSKSAETILQPSKAKKLIYMISNFPVVSSRDFLVYGYGINCLRDEGSIYLLVKSIEENSGVFEDVFKSKENKKYVRADIKIFGFEIKFIGKNKISMNGIINCDPKISLIPGWFINQVVKQFAKTLFNKLVTIAKNYRGSKYENKNPSEMDKKFYDFIKSEGKEILGID